MYYCFQISGGFVAPKNRVPSFVHRESGQDNNKILSKIKPVKQTVPDGHHQDVSNPLNKANSVSIQNYICIIIIFLFVKQYFIILNFVFQIRGGFVAPQNRRSQFCASGEWKGQQDPQNQGSQPNTSGRSTSRRVRPIEQYSKCLKLHLIYY